MMRQNSRTSKGALSSLQKQAVLVCVVCALALLLTIGITLSIVTSRSDSSVDHSSEGNDVSAENNFAEHYQINETSAALLTETDDAGQDYQDQTLFIGDSNTVRLYTNGLISLQQFCAKEGIGTAAALNDGIVKFKGDDTEYTIAQAVAKMKPRRVVVMLGTNDNGMSAADYINNYTSLVQAIQASYPYTDIIVNTVPPIPENHSNYPQMDQSTIDDFNMALLTMCENLGVKFLNTAEALKDDTGYGNADYYQGNDIHLSKAGLKVILNYLRTHAYQSEDRRPDTSNVPSRAEYTPTPSAAVADSDPASEAASSDLEDAPSDVKFEASYRVDKAGGGTLSCGSDSGKTSLTYNITDSTQSVTVTAEPATGYVFVKWSDGNTNSTRTDTEFKQNIDVTAVFSLASIQISREGNAEVGREITFKANLQGKYLSSDSIKWYANGSEVTDAAGRTVVTIRVTQEMAESTYKIYATASYNGTQITSNTLNVKVTGGLPIIQWPEGPYSTSDSSDEAVSSSSAGTDLKDDVPEIDTNDKDAMSSKSESDKTSSSSTAPASSFAHSQAPEEGAPSSSDGSTASSTEKKVAATGQTPDSGIAMEPQAEKSTHDMSSSDLYAGSGMEPKETQKLPSAHE